MLMMLHRIKMEEQQRKCSLFIFINEGPLRQYIEPSYHATIQKRLTFIWALFIAVFPLKLIDGQEILEVSFPSKITGHISILFAKAFGENGKNLEI